ncbi:hypothetical protein LO771_09665 [Streptacidiphilus sp. ASG 303]|uniref:hypothetical protein n=1 Tax=Streptacidiphilus sp. ASG 303 TaxID=2896847 RepID=UPI001E62D0DE|nr:hypothetical protein [Streptacidiphilus sp. ASG 303]MCD0482659.1 hypothetical protein [Streptacidiphilus sp. ASG 303]
MRTDGRTARWRTTAGVLAAAGALLAAGCGAPGQLHDGGRTRAVAPHPTPQALWPGAGAASSPSAPAPARGSAPAPLRGVAAASGDIRTVPAAEVLEKDPALERDERVALLHCPHCGLRPPQYRDLTGDGRPELITALVTADDRAVLRVYALRATRVVPVLGLPLSPGFTADTVGPDLVVHDPAGPSVRTSSTYRWDGRRLAVLRVEATGSGAAADGLACVTGGTPAPAPVTGGGTGDVVGGPAGGGTGAAPSPVPTTVARTGAPPAGLPPAGAPWSAVPSADGGAAR